MMKKKTSNFINGAAILASAGIIVKILGALFRIPLNNIIGSEGVGYYQLAYPTYSFLLIISSAGFPVAISKLVSGAVNRGDYGLVKRTFTLSGKLMALLGAAGMLLMIIFSGIIAKIQGNADSKSLLIALAPAVFFVTLLSAYRGYFQGLQNMKPTALTQIAEQLIKLAAGLGLSVVFIKKGAVWGAFGAILGVSLSELAALIIIVFIYNKNKRQFAFDGTTVKARVYVSSKKIITDIIAIAIPVAIGSAILPLVSMIDQLVVISGLKKIIPMIEGIPYSVDDFKSYVIKNNTHDFDASLLTFGELKEAFPNLYEDYITSLATKLYGIMSGGCSPITSLPLVFSTSIAASLVPSISQAKEINNRKSLRVKAFTGFRMTALITFPCAVGIFVLAEPIIRTLYGSYSAWEIAFAVRCLRVMSLTVFALPLVHTATAVLQGVGKQNLPVINLALGVAFLKLPITLILVRNPHLNIVGAAIGSVSVYAFAAFADIFFVHRATGMRIKPIPLFIKPLASSAAMGIVAYFVNKIFSSLLGGAQAGKLLGVVVPMGIAIVAAVITYAAVALITRTVKVSDIRLLLKR